MSQCLSFPIPCWIWCPCPKAPLPAESFRHSLDLARHAERWGYPPLLAGGASQHAGIASAATAVLIGHLAGGTNTLRLGAGGIMLPNHSPLVIAEQFGTLSSLYPDRIDLGLGRAPAPISAPCGRCAASAAARWTISRRMCAS